MNPVAGSRTEQNISIFLQKGGESVCKGWNLLISGEFENRFCFVNKRGYQVLTDL